MSQANFVTIAALSMTLRWRGVPAKWHPDADPILNFSPGKQTDCFIDPEGTVTILNAPALWMPAQEPCLLKARVTADAAATFDAGVLAIYQSDQVWAKLCLEMSPQGQLAVGFS